MLRSLIKYLPLLGTLLLAASLISLYYFWPGFQQSLAEAAGYVKAGDSEALAAWFRQYGIWGPLLIVLFMVVQMFLIFFPTWLPMIVAVVGYGPIGGFLISIIAVTASSTIGYAIGLYLSQKTLRLLIGKEKEKRLEVLVRRYGAGAVFLAHISPVLNTDAISFIGGMLRMGYRRFIVATLAGAIPLAAAIAYLGKDLETLKTGLFWLGGAAVIIYIIYIWIDIRKRKR